MIGYIWYEAPEEEQNFSTLLEFINASEAREDDEEFKNAVDELLRNWNRRNRSTLQFASIRSISWRQVIYALSDFLIMIVSWLVKQSLRAFSFQEVQP